MTDTLSRGEFATTGDLPKADHIINGERVAAKS